MLALFKKTCMFCNGVAAKGFRVPDRLKGFVCGQCHQRWVSTGRKCAICGTPVSGVQEVGAFVEQRMLGHADCGGLRLFA
jgi:hypothetical protein